MLTSFEVGAVFTIFDRATPVLEKLAGTMRGVDAELKKVLGSLERFGNFVLSPKLLESVNAVSGAFGRIDKASEATRKELTRFGEMPIAVKGVVGSVDQIAGSLKALPGIGGKAREGLTAEFDKPLAVAGTIQSIASVADAIKALPKAAEIAKGKISTALTGFTSGAMRELGRFKAELAGLGNLQLAGAGGGASTRHAAGHGRGGGGGGFHVGVAGVPIGPAHIRGSGPGMGTAIGGAVALYGVYEIFKKVEEIATIQQRMVIGGVPAKEIASATKLSFGLGERFGQPASSILETINEIRNPLGGVEKAMEHVETLSKAMVVLRAVDSKTGGNVAGKVYDLVKSAEFRNAITGPEFDKAIDLTVRAAVATGGKVDPRQFLQFSKYAKSALPGLSDKFLYQYGPELAQEFGGSSGGTALASLYQQIVSGQMRTTGLRLVDKLGELDRKKTEFDKHGRIVRTEPGANRLGTLFKSDPAEAMAQQIRDMAKMGITDEGKQRDYLSQVYGNRNAAQMAFTLGYQRMRLDRGAAGVAQTMNVGAAADQLIAHDPATNMRAFTAAWENMLASMGSSLIEPAIAVMKQMTSLFNSIGDFAREHPTITTGVAGAAFGVGSAALIGGISGMVGRGIANVVRPLAAVGRAAGLGSAAAATTTGAAGSAAGAAAAGAASGAGAGIAAAVRAGIRGGIVGGMIYEGGKWLIDQLPRPKNAPDPDKMRHDLDPLFGPNSIPNLIGRAIEHIRKSDFQKKVNDMPMSPIAFKGAEGSIRSMLSTTAEQGLVTGLPKGAAAAAPKLLGGFSGAAQQGTLDGLIAVSGSAQTVIASWFRGALGGLLQGAGGGSGLISNASYTPGGGGLISNAGYMPGGSGGGLSTNAAGIPQTASLAHRVLAHLTGGGGGGGGGGVATLPILNAGLPGIGALRDRGLAAMRYLVEQKGWTPAAAAIAMGNAQQESNITSGGLSGDAGSAHHMFQWREGRFANLNAFARARGKSPSDFFTNLDFFDEERKTRSGLERTWHQERDLSRAGILGHLFEGYGDNSTATRVRNAANWLQLYGSMPKGDTPFNSNVTGLPGMSNEKGSLLIADPRFAGKSKFDSGISYDRDGHPIPVGSGNSSTIKALHEAVKALTSHVKDLKVQKHQEVHMDGKKVGQMVAAHVTKEQTRMAWAPRQAPHHDSRMYPTAFDHNIGFS